MTEAEVLPVSFGPDGLVPVVVQDAATDAVLMLAFMNEEALRLTRQTKQTHFWSRSRGKLWHKGETSGHCQHVEAILVNCNQNSLLIKVRQIGAVCHKGYPTCFFRELDDDGNLRTVINRWFDPSEVYDGSESLQSLTRRWFEAYAYLGQIDLSGQSTTSHLLHGDATKLIARAADELQELAGALNGTHRHSDLESDITLEAGQSLYWLALVAVAHGATWEHVRPDRALISAEETLSVETAARLLQSEAERWLERAGSSAIAERVHASMALVAQACISAGVSPRSVVRRDLDEMRSRPYLKAFFT